MKFMHLSDLHLGKRLNEFSLLEDQDHILSQILKIAAEEKPDGVLIAGDVYDKSIPSTEAVKLFDRFLTELSGMHTKVFIISGNHDSAERMAFGAGLMERSGVFISRTYDGKVAPVSLEDTYGRVDLYLLPFIKEAHVRNLYPEETIASCTDAMQVAIRKMEVDPANRNILVAHQYITGAERSESEIMPVGGADNVDASVFDAFHYVALGHLHKRQTIGGENRIHYCGTPLKYSFSEMNDEKSVTIVEMDGEGTISMRARALEPLRKMREIRGTYEELVRRENYEGTDTKDYLRVVLTDEEDILDAMAKLRTIYPNIMKLDYDNRRTRNTMQLEEAADMRHKQPIDLIAEFYSIQNGDEMSDGQKALMVELLENIWEEEI